MCAYSRRLNHCTEVEAHAFWQFHYAVVVDDEEVLCAAVSLESLHAQMFAYVILSAFARVALAANQLRTSCDVVARLAYRYSAAACHNNSRIFMTLNYGVERSGMESVVRVNLAAADADSLDVDEYLVLLEVFCLRCCYLLEFDVLGCY